MMHSPCMSTVITYMPSYLSQEGLSGMIDALEEATLGLYGGATQIPKPLNPITPKTLNSVTPSLSPKP